MKKVVATIVMCVMILGVASCGQEEDTVTLSRDEYEKLAGISEEDVAASEDVVVEPDPYEEMDAEMLEIQRQTLNKSYDEILAMLEVDEDFAKEYGGYYLRQNDKLYTLDLLPVDIAEQYGLGYWAGDNTGFVYSFKVNDYQNIRTGGPIPAIKASSSDSELVVYGQDRVALYGTNVVGTGTRYELNSNFLRHTQNPLREGGLTSVENLWFLYNENGEKVDLMDIGVSDLDNFGKEYTIQYWDDSRYGQEHEVNKGALMDSYVYAPLNYVDPDYLYTVQYSDDGAVVKLDEVVPGRYSVGGNGIIEIY